MKDIKMVPPNKQEDHIIHGIEAMVSIYEQKQSNLTPHTKVMDWLSRILGKPQMIYFSFFTCFLWIWTNFIISAVGGKSFDPAPYSLLQGLICFGAMITALVIASSQRRQGMNAEHNAHLDLQINLLSEKKLAKIISLIEELRKDMPQVKNRIDLEAAALAIAVEPGQLSEIIDHETKNGVDKD